MTNIFTKNNSTIVKSTCQNCATSDKALWVDLLNPTNSEISTVTKTYNIHIPTKEEREEIESSARYWEDNDSITMNTRFLVKIDSLNLKNETITFLLRDKILFTIRYSGSMFDEIEQRVIVNPRNFEDGFDLISKIFEVKVEKDADMIENFTAEIRALRRGVFEKTYDYNEVLDTLANLQELNTRLRDSLFDKRRALTALLNSYKPNLEVKKNITIIVKDLNSLIDFCVANMNALDNIHTLFASQINIEQNKIIKIFTIATVAMMPPTLIGTIYGMNFKYMPELELIYAYPIILIIMIISTILPILYFKKKGWL